jgi:hypothetical protein
MLRHRNTNESVSFSLDMWDRSNVVAERCQTGTKTIDGLLVFFKEKVALDLQYSKGLKKIAKKAAQATNCEGGSYGLALAAFTGLANTTALNAEILTTDVEEQVSKPLQQLKENLEAANKKLKQTADSYDQRHCEVEQRLATAHAAVAKSCLDVQTCKTAVKRLDARRIERMQQRLKRAEQRNTAANNDHNNGGGGGGVDGAAASPTAAPSSPPASSSPPSTTSSTAATQNLFSLSSMKQRLKQRLQQHQNQNSAGVGGVVNPSDYAGDANNTDDEYDEERDEEERRAKLVAKHSQLSRRVLDVDQKYMACIKDMRSFRKKYDVATAYVLDKFQKTEQQRLGGMGRRLQEYMSVTTAMMQNQQRNNGE